MLQKPVILCFAILVLTGCKSLRSISSKDNSNSVASSKKKQGNTQFLENVSVTPGTGNAATHNTYSKIYPGTLPANSEAANDLKVKYASLLNIPSGNLTNVLLLQNIDYWWGTRYCMGGLTENCVDCSGFAQILMRDVYHINIPRTAQEQYNFSQRLDDKDLQQGDLVFFHTAGRRDAITHVGIYIANSKFVHAGTSTGVTISDLNDAYWQPKYRGAGRMK